ncbi:AbiV family abortive infection protein [Citrobacter braakii]|nr:AbiV family abortive infection protein [Citrobacter braakii]
MNLREVSMKEIEQVFQKGTNFKLKSTDEFDKAIKHIYNLINDSYFLHKNKSYGSSIFFSISVIEEVAKTHIGFYAGIHDEKNQERVKKDKLYDHKTKEIIGSNYSILLGERLQEKIGESNINKIMEFAHTGKLKELRESSIYSDFKGNKLEIPSEIFTESFSRELLLFSIESFDDNLVGYTNYSLDISKETDKLFDSL